MKGDNDPTAAAQLAAARAEIGALFVPCTARLVLTVSPAERREAQPGALSLALPFLLAGLLAGLALFRALAAVP